MAGRGPAPKEKRQRERDTKRSQAAWKPAPGIGWQHGRAPAPPAGLRPASMRAWKAWFSSWFAAHWIPADLPAIRQIIMLYDQVERGEFQRASELRLQMDTYGITPKGQQDRRWKPPEPAQDAPKTKTYGHLEAVE